MKLVSWSQVKVLASRLRAKPCVYVFQAVPAWTKWQKSDHVTGRRQLNLSLSSRAVRIYVVGMTTIIAANNAVSMNGNHFALKTVPVSFVRTGCLRRGLRKPRPTLREIDARPQRRRRQPRKLKRPWTIPWRYTLRKRRYNFLPSLPKSEGSSKTKRTKTKATTSESSQPMSVASSVSVVGRPSSHGSDRRKSRSPECKRRHGDDRRQDSPRHQSSRCDGSRRESERFRPSSSGGLSSRRRAESGSVSKASDTRPSASSSRHHHHSSGDRGSLSSTSSRTSPDRRSSPSHERRRQSADRTGQTYVTRRDVKLSPKSSKPPEKRTITVVSSPARQVHVESAPEVPVPAPVADGPVADGPAGADPAAGNGSDKGGGTATRNGMAAGNGTATGDGSDTGDGPATGDGPVTVDDPASDDPADVSEVESELHFDEPDETDGPALLPIEARIGTPAATSPGDGPDVSRSTWTSSLLFPSIPRSINQETLVDFMSMWTLLQRRMDQLSVPVAPACPPDQSAAPAPRHDSTNRRSATLARTTERRPKSPERFLHTPQSTVSSFLRRAREPERKARTPVRQARTPVRQRSESRETRSRSPLSRSSSVESPARDKSPLQVHHRVQERHFWWRGRRRWQQEDLGSSIQDLQTGCVHV